MTVILIINKKSKAFKIVKKTYLFDTAILRANFRAINKNFLKNNF